MDDETRGLVSHALTALSGESGPLCVWDARSGSFRKLEVGAAYVRELISTLSTIAERSGNAVTM